MCCVLVPARVLLPMWADMLCCSALFVAIVGNLNEEIVCFGLVHPTYSTWTGRNIYLEARYVVQGSCRCPLCWTPVHLVGLGAWMESTNSVSALRRGPLCPCGVRACCSCSNRCSACTLLRASLQDLYVRPAFRRQGVGERVVRAIAGAAFEAGCPRVQWSVLDWCV